MCAFLLLLFFQTGKETPDWDREWTCCQGVLTLLVLRKLHGSTVNIFAGSVLLVELNASQKIQQRLLSKGGACWRGQR